MKPKEYVRKYALNQPGTVDGNSVFADLNSDFLGMVEYLQASKQLNETRMQTVKRDFEAKLASLKAGAHATHQVLLDNLQQDLFRKTIRPLDEKLFGEARRERARKKREEEAWEEFGGFSFNDFLLGLLLGGLQRTRVPKPEASWTFMELPVEASVEQVQSQFRELSKRYHPDCGGQASDFIKLMEAKNQCLAYVNSLK